MPELNMSIDDFRQLKEDLLNAMDHRHTIHMQEIDQKNLDYIKKLDAQHRVERKRYSKRIWSAVAICVGLIGGAMGYSVDKSVEAIKVSTAVEQKTDWTVRVMEATDEGLQKSVDQNTDEIEQMRKWLLENSSIVYRGKSPFVKPTVDK